MEPRTAKDIIKASREIATSEESKNEEDPLDGKAVLEWIDEMETKHNKKHYNPKLILRQSNKEEVR